MSTNTIHYIKLFLVQIMWAGTFVASEIALVNASPLLLAVIRFVLTLFIYLIVFRNSLTIENISQKDFIVLFLMGFFGIFAYTYLLHLGLLFSNASFAALLIPTTQPILTMLLSFIILKELIKKSHIVTIIIGFLGASVVISSSFINMDMANFKGSILIIFATLSFSIYSVCSSFLSKNISSSQITLFSTMFGTFILTFLLFIIEPDSINSLEFNSDLYFSLFYLVIFATVLPYIWWNNAIKDIGSTITGSFTLILPPFAILFAYILLGHTITSMQLIGGSISMLALIILLKGKIDEKV